ncbi:MAG TPA: cytochrome C [Nitrospirota bacterium]|nr:cytochrome C [Nitrospirota bacterium]
MTKAISFTILVTAALFLGSASFAAEAAKPSIELGKKLFSDTSLGTNGRTCSACHPSEKDIAGLANKKAWFGGSAKTLEQAINICIKGPLEGKPLPEDSVQVKSIAMYMRSLVK